MLHHFFLTQHRTDAEHFLEGTEICTESVMTPEDIKKVTPEGYGGDFEPTMQAGDDE